MAQVAASYMPLAHGADRGIAWQTTHAGGRIGFARNLNMKIRIFPLSLFDAFWKERF